MANEQRELATRNSAKVVALEQELLAARREIDALKGSAQTTAAEREEARRALAAVQRELDAMRRVARDGSAQARAIADKQERALEGQRQIADGLARELAAVQREVEDLKAKATLASLAKAADVKAGLAAEASLADARRVIDQERQKAGMLERDLAAARQSLAALEATADQAAAAEATAMRDLQAAEAATKRLSEALLLQRQRADEATGELKTARQERDAAKQEAIRVATAQREALEDEQGKAISLARELAAARKEVDSLKARGQRRIARVENTPKARATWAKVQVKVSGQSPDQAANRRCEKFAKQRFAVHRDPLRRRRRRFPPVYSPRGRQGRISPIDHTEPGQRARPMIHHASFGSNDLARARAFYDAILPIVGVSLMKATDTMLDYGSGKVIFSVETPVDGKPATVGNGSHIAFEAKDRAVVDHFHQAALSHGGTSDGSPACGLNTTPTTMAHSSVIQMATRSRL